MINKTEIRRNYHSHAIVINLSNADETISGMIVDDSPNDHCLVVKDPNLIEYFETREKSLLERVYFKDVKAIQYQ